MHLPACPGQSCNIKVGKSMRHCWRGACLISLLLLMASRHPFDQARMTLAASQQAETNALIGNKALVLH